MTTFPACLALFSALALGALACGARSQLAGLDEVAPIADAAVDAPIVCVTPQPSQEPAPAYIEIVLDGSGSMADDGKWEAATLALGGLFDEYLARADDTVSMGLLVFADHKDLSGGDGPYPTTSDVAPGFVDKAQYDALRGRIAGTRPVGPTPTFQALTGGYGVLRSYVPAPRLRAPGRKVVVLVSDGAPTAASASGEVDAEKQKTIDLVASQLVTSPALSTFAIGIGPFPPPAWFDYDPAFMSHLAIAGGTRSKLRCDPATNLVEDLCHIQITPSPLRTAGDLAADMLKALHDVRSRTTDVCSFVLVGDPSRLDRARTKVAIASHGTRVDVPRDEADGWSYTSASGATGIVLKGAACDTVLDDATATVTMTFGCT